MNDLKLVIQYLLNLKYLIDIILIYLFQNSF